MHLRRSVSFTPDKSVKWRRSELTDGTLYLSDEAVAENAAQLTNPYPFEIGPRIGRGHFGNVYGNGGVALKHSELQPGMHPDVWEKYAGLGSVKLNVALQEGLNKLGENARLPNGTKITTPTYLGAFVLRRHPAVRVLMTHESGDTPYIGTDVLTIGQQATRRIVYDAALDSVGFDPEQFAGYDDKRDNLLVRRDANTPEIVKLDVCNRAVVEDDWQLPTYHSA